VEVGYEQGRTARVLRAASIRRARPRRHTQWPRAQHGLPRPAPPAARQPRGALGCGDAWWASLTGGWALRRRCGGAAPPQLQAWTEAPPVRVLPNAPDRPAPEPQASAWEGLGRPDTQGRLRRVGQGRPGRAGTPQLLGWRTDRGRRQGKPRCGWGGTRPRGTSARPGGQGSRRTTAVSSRQAAGAAWEAPCRARVPGCTASTPHGALARGPGPNRIASCLRTNGSIASVPSRTVSSSTPWHNESRGLALAF
jgi:hypothetical protein